MNSSHGGNLDEIEFLDFTKNAEVPSSIVYPLYDLDPVLTRKNEHGEVEVLATYGQDKWDFSSVAGYIFHFYFCCSNKNATGIISVENWEVLKRITAFLWQNYRYTLSFGTIHYYYKQMRALLVLCTSRKINILTTTLSGKASLYVFTRHARSEDALRIAKIFYYARHRLGFNIITPYEAALVSKYLSRNEYEQTPYIPERIHAYQVLRIKSMLLEFIENISGFESLFERLESLYLSSGYMKRNKGRLSSNTHNISPFREDDSSFLDLAVFYRVDDIIERWMVPSNKTLKSILDNDGARILSSYCTAICNVGLLYLANFSGMRKKELSSLKASCFKAEYDEELGLLCFLKGPTTKTISDAEALWVTDEFSEQVVRALTVIANMRVRCAKYFNRGVVEQSDLDDPLLLLRAYEPWGRARGVALDKSVSLTKDLSYSVWKVFCPNLFEEVQITITEEDFKAAKYYTPSLSLEQFQVGSIWPFALHQLRRTLLVNAVEHGVSLNSVQYQAKHKTYGMSAYYTRKNKGMKLSKEMSEDYMKEVVNHLTRSAQKLSESNFVSIYGEEHKSRIIEFIEVRDITALKAAAEKGTFGLKETLYGVCLRKSFCSSGGISYVGDCPACSDGLGDVHKLPILELLLADLRSQLSDMQEGNLDYQAVQHQISVVEDAIIFLRKGC